MGQEAANICGWSAGSGTAALVEKGSVPATPVREIARVTELTGQHDAAPVVFEPFGHWVTKDDFVDGARPDFVPACVHMVQDVARFELMKLQILNGTHSSLADLGYLGGFEAIADCMADPAYRRFAQKLWQHEIIPTLTPPEDVDLHATPERWKAAIETLQSVTARDRSRWMAARNCLGGFWGRWLQTFPARQSLPDARRCGVDDPCRRYRHCCRPARHSMWRVLAARGDCRAPRGLAGGWLCLGGRRKPACS